VLRTFWSRPTIIWHGKISPGLINVILDLTSPARDIRTHSFPSIFSSLVRVVLHASPFKTKQLQPCGYQHRLILPTSEYMNRYLIKSHSHTSPRPETSRRQRAFYIDFSRGWIMAETVSNNAEIRPVVSFYSSVFLITRHIQWMIYWQLLTRWFGFSCLLLVTRVISFKY
jgi:hypothetical protein